VQPLEIDTNGTSNLTVTGTRANGAPLPDQTVVHFTLDDNLGTITPNPVETSGGIARAQFVAAGRSGTVHITAVSGTATTETADIVIGVARVQTVILKATPASLPVGGGKVNLTATVLDKSGNPVSGVQVFFSTTEGTLKSGGGAVITNSAGLATDVLTTTKTATVTATTGGSAQAGSVTINVEAGQAPVCSFAASPSSSPVGTTVSFVDTSTDDGTIVKFTWNFGDSLTAQGKNTTHVYSDAGVFTVVHTITDDTGLSASCTQTVTATSAAPTCDFVISPTSGQTGQDISFTDISSDPDGSIVRSTWDFGDGDSASGFSVTHSYDDAGTFTIVHEVTDDQGNTTICATKTITITAAP